MLMLYFSAVEYRQPINLMTVVKLPHFRRTSRSMYKLPKNVNFEFYEIKTPLSPREKRFCVMTQKTLGDDVYFHL